MARTRYQTSTSATPVRSLPAAALRAVLREGYTRIDLRHDLLAGLVVGVVAIPLAMALAIAVGAPPQHGLYPVIVAGFVVAALGGSRTQVTGPTAAFVVILAPIVSKFGIGGLLVSGLLGGLMLVAMGLLRFGRLIEFIPHPVTTGFTAGIAVVIATLQLKDLFGLQTTHNPEHFFNRVAAMLDAAHTASPWEALIGGGTLALLLLFPRITRRIPSPLVALPCMALVSIALSHAGVGFHVATIASRFHTQVGSQLVYGIPQLPPMWMLPWREAGAHGLPFVFDFAVLRALLPGAFAIAMLGAIESLLSAVVADGMAHTKHDPDAELLALGVGNLLAPFFGGIPATGAIARTATGIRAGARSPFAAMTHAVAVLAAVLALAPLLGYLPMASLAGLLVLVAWNMSEAKHFVHILRVAPKSDVAVLLTCFGLTVAVDMVAGVGVGMVLAALLFMRRMADVTQVRLATDRRSDLPGPLPARVTIYEISGPLFFGAAQRAMAALQAINEPDRAVILLMEDVHTMDATGLVALESALEQLRRHKCLAILCAVQAQPLQVLRKAHVPELPGVLLCASASEALAAATAHTAKTPASA